MATGDNITGPKPETQAPTKEALMSFADSSGLGDKAGDFVYLVEAKVLIVKKRQGVDVQGGSLSLETISPDEVREALRTIEQGEMNITGFDETSWDIASRFASQSPESANDVVIPWNENIHPRLTASDATRAEAVEQLAQLYSELEIDLPRKAV